MTAKGTTPSPSPSLRGCIFSKAYLPSITRNQSLDRLSLNDTGGGPAPQSLPKPLIYGLELKKKNYFTVCVIKFNELLMGRSKGFGMYQTCP